MRLPSAARLSVCNKPSDFATIDLTYNLLDQRSATMRHRRKGRILGRNPSHQRALLRSLASALFLTERDAEFDDNKPKVKGRIITTISKAKEVRPLVEKCITLACKALAGRGRGPRVRHHRRPRQRRVEDVAQERTLGEVERGDRAGRRRPPPRA